MRALLFQLTQDFLLALVILAWLFTILKINIDDLRRKEQRFNKIKTLLIPFPDRPRVSKYKIGNKRYVSYDDYYGIYKLAQMIKIQTMEEDSCRK